MAITTIYKIFHNGKEWVALLDNYEFCRGKMLAKIKQLIKTNSNTEEEWAALALIDRRTTEDRWRTKAKEFYDNLSR